jgi:glycosyltransferase involved in cell wall biosynthesis
MKKRRLVLDASNLTIHAQKFIRTGIQEVVYQTARHLAELRAEYPELEIVCLPAMPRRFGNVLSAPTIAPYPRVPRFILEQLEIDWGVDLKAWDYKPTDAQLMDVLSGADFIHFQSMIDIGPVLEAIAEAGAKPRISMTVYDLIPVYFPEYCDDRIARWYAATYLPSMGRHVGQAFCISRQTAIDLAGHPVTQHLKARILPLPYDFPERGETDPTFLKTLGLSPRGYLVFLGSLEPRKNFEGLLAGFEEFVTRHPKANLKLVIVGATGWKNYATLERMAKSPAAPHLVKTGYLEDQELSQLIAQASGVAMLSFYEGYGLPLAQAYSMGVPALTTLGSSLPEACAGGGVFVEPADPLSVAAGIWQLTQQPRSKPPAQLSEWTWKNYARNLVSGILEGA